MDELSFSVKTLSKNVILHVYERTPTKNHDVNINSFLHTLHLCCVTWQEHLFKHLKKIPIEFYACKLIYCYPSNASTAFINQLYELNLGYIHASHQFSLQESYLLQTIPSN